MKLHWENLTSIERAEYMYLQMSPSTGGNSGYLPEGCSECGVCGTPVSGGGWCHDCYTRWRVLRDKLEGRIDRDAMQAESRTELGAKLRALRAKAIANGMELLSEDEIGREHD